MKVHGSERAAGRNSRVVAGIGPFLHGNGRKTREVVSLELVEAAGIEPAPCDTTQVTTSNQNVLD